MKAIVLVNRILCLLLIVSFLGACNEGLDDSIKEDPYKGGKTPFGIQLKDEAPSPESANPEDLVEFKAVGLENYWNPDTKKAEFKFFLSEQEVEVVNVTESSVTIRVPKSISTGSSYIEMEGQIFYGPTLNILGNVSVDKSYGLWRTQKVTGGVIFNYLKGDNLDNAFYILGEFTAVGPHIEWIYDRGGIALIDKQGLVAPRYSSGFGIGHGASSFVTSEDGYAISSRLLSMSYVNNSAKNILLSGYYDEYESVENIFNITVLKNNVALETKDIQLPRRLTGKLEWKKVPSFNGGTLEQVLLSFATSDEQVIAVGNFTQYCRNDYDNSFYEIIKRNYKEVGPIIRMNMAGELDTEYRVGKSKPEGEIKDAVMDKDGNIIIAGNLSAFDGEQVFNLLKVNTASGELDQTFKSNIGSGVNGAISMIRYNTTLDKFVIVGEFTEVSGEPCPGIAVINGDGTLDRTFIPREIEGGKISFASLLDLNKIVIAGTFSKYDGVMRPGFLILEADGEAMQGFNVPGQFSGQIYQAVETYATTGFKGLLLLGDIYRFNGETARNAVMIELDF